MRLLTSVLLVLCCCGVFHLHAYDSNTAAFLDINTDTRANGMGNAGGAFAEIPSGYWLNPATIAGVDKTTISLTHMQLFEGASLYHHAGCASKVGEGLYAAVNAVLLTIPDVPEYPDFRATADDSVREYLSQPESELATGSFASNDFGLTVTLTRVFKTRLDLGWQYFVVPLEVPVGINFKYIRQQLGDHGSGSGTGVDIGTLLRIDARRLFGERDFLGYLGFGLAVKDVGGTVVSWESDYEAILPYSTLFSCTYEQPLPAYRSVIRLCYDYDFRYAESRGGLEYVFAGILAARCGINPRSFTAGAGINLFGGSFDYAFDAQDFGNIHRVSVGYRIGGER